MKRGEILLLISFIVTTFSGGAAAWLFACVCGLGPLLTFALSLLVGLAAFILFAVIVTKAGW
jgi:hypothetical protein